MTPCANCGREHPDSDKFCRYCGVAVDTPVAEPWPRWIRVAIVAGATVLLVITGVWLQIRPTPIRPSEVSGQRQTTTALEAGATFAPDQDDVFAQTESLLSEATGNLVIIPPEMDQAIVLSGTAPRRRIVLPPANRWEITDDGLVGFSDDAPTTIVPFSPVTERTQSKAQQLYTDLNGELIHTWADDGRIQVRPVFDEAEASGGDFSPGAPIVGTRRQTTGTTIGPLLTTFRGDTFAWNGDGEWEQIADGVAAVATDPIVTSECEGAIIATTQCVTRLTNPHTGEERIASWPAGTSTYQFIVQEGGFPSPDMSYVLTAAGLTLVETTSGSTQALSVPSRSRDNTALWALDSSIVGVAGEGLRLFDRQGAVLVDVIPVDTTTGPRRGTWQVTARFVPQDAFGRTR